MSPSKPNQNMAKPPPNNSWEESQREIRERNDEARRAGNKERADKERRADADQRARDKRGGVFR